MTQEKSPASAANTERAKDNNQSKITILSEHMRKLGYTVNKEDGSIWRGIHKLTDEQAKVVREATPEPTIFCDEDMAYAAQKEYEMRESSGGLWGGPYD